MDKGKLNKMLRDYGMESILGGGLAKILTALAENSGGEKKEITLHINGSAINKINDPIAIGEVCTLLGVSEDNALRLVRGEYDIVRIISGGTKYCILEKQYYFVREGMGSEVVYGRVPFENGSFASGSYFMISEWPPQEAGQDYGYSISSNVEMLVYPQ